MKKESLSVIFVKTLLAVLLFAGIGTIIIGGAWLIGKQGKMLDIEPVESVVNKTSNWQTYNNPKANFTFEYSDDWEVKQDYLYETCMGVKAKNRTVIIKPLGNKSIEAVNINMPEVGSNYNSEICRFENLCGENHIVTCGKESKTIKVYYQIIDSFQCVSVKR